MCEKDSIRALLAAEGSAWAEGEMRLEAGVPSMISESGGEGGGSTLKRRARRRRWRGTNGQMRWMQGLIIDKVTGKVRGVEGFEE
jgi:hypothetical protein